MIRKTQNQILSIVGLAIAIFVLSGNVFGMQDKVSPLSDFQYKKDYADVETILKEADVQKRADALTAFVKTHPISKAFGWVSSSYMECAKAQKDPAKAIAMVEAYLALIPTKEAVQAADPARAEEFLKGVADVQKQAFLFFIDAYSQAGNLPKAAESAEKLYELTPDKALLPVLTDFYLKMKNNDKFIPYAQKILAEFPMEEAYSTAIQLAGVYIEKNDIAAANDLFTKVMAVYGEKVPPNTKEENWNLTRAYAYKSLAIPVYQKKDYAQAQPLFEKVVKFNPKQEDAYYFLAMCKWQNKDPEGAIESFAKTIVLKGSNAAKAQTYIEQLYKPRHNNTLDGLDQVLQKAKTDLGI